MLPKPQRLNLKKDFKWVASGKKLETRYCKLFIRVGNNKSPLIGIATSGKVFPQAVDRNRSKRLISAAFETIYTKLPATVNIVALPKAGVIKVKSKDVLLDLEQELGKAKII